MRRPELPALTGLRFFAALWVVLFHTAKDRLAGVSVIGPLVSMGYVGVSLFFVLSGFILVYTYWREEGELDAATFGWHRVARVLPVYVLAWIVAAPFALHRLPDPAVTGLLSLTLLQAWVPQHACGWNCPGWSLSAEAFFYGLFPLLLLALRRRPGLLGAGAILGWGIGLYIASLTFGHNPHGTAYLAVEYNPALRLPEFALGMLAGRWYVRGGRVALHPFAVATMTLLACVGFAWLPMPLLHNGLLAPVFLLLTLALAPSRGWLATRPFMRLGAASYAMYLLHVPLYFAAWQLLGMAKIRIETDWLAWTVYLTTTIGIALAVLQLVEEPARRWLRAHQPAQTAIAVNSATLG